MMNDIRLPIKRMKQAYMKLESFVDDMREISGDEKLSLGEKYEINRMTDIGSLIMFRILNILKKEVNEDDFINDYMEMDEISDFPENNIVDEFSYEDLDDEEYEKLVKASNSYDSTEL